MPFGGADLHFHSSASDGVEAPAALVARALAAGLSVAALTDHDTVSGVEAFEAAAAGTGLVAAGGAELSVDEGGEDVHLLGLFVDPAEPDLASRLEFFREVRTRRGEMIVERLRRKLVSFDRARGGGVTTYPSAVLNGPFVVLTNEFAGSDGDIFPAAVQIEGLAPVIGMRSWGGVVGIRGDKTLQDGGMLTQPEFAWWDAKQGWGLENRGVIPDIEVQNLPQELAKGVDSQLDRGIREVLRLREERPPVKPEFGPARDRSREGFRKEAR